VTADAWLSASCHCGAVRLEIARKPETLTECTCSICRRYGARWAYCKRKAVSLSCDPGTLTTYSWGERRIEFCRCGACGCVTHYEVGDKGPDAHFAVNARMMEPGDVAGIPVRVFDGAKTWKFLDA
jgi:hypothetical protein